MLRVTGLPSPSRCPQVTVRRGEGQLELLFSGEQDATRIDVDLRLLEPIEDLETLELELLAKLQAQGYDARLDQRAP